jgi:TonB family protein
MAMIGNDARPPSLVARMEERFFAPLTRNAFAHRTWFFVTVAIILAIHGALLGYLLYRDRTDPVRLAQQEETPVEIIVEKPPAPQKPPAPEKPPPQELEKPASSAPRAENDEKVDTQETQKETHAPKAPEPPKDGRPEPAKEAAAPSDAPAEPDKVEEAAAKPETKDKDTEALDTAVPLPPKRPEALSAKATPPAKTRAPKAILQQFAGASELHDFSFAKPTKKSPVSGGSEDSRYLAIVFGMIMQHRRAIATEGREGSVTVGFNVDGSGNVIGAGIERTSGDPEIDAAATAAIYRASPFPPPPEGAPHGLIATIDFGDGVPSYKMGRRGQ